MILNERRIAKIDELGCAWSAADPEQDSAYRLGIEAEIFEICLQGGVLSKKEEDALGEVFIDFRKNFDAGTGKLSDFLRNRFEKRETDIRRKDQGIPRITVMDPVTGKKTREYVDPFIRTIVDEEGTETDPMDYAPAGWAYDPTEELNAYDTLSDALVVMQNLSKHLTGRANNPDRRNYFQMFFTDGIVEFLRSGVSISDEGFRHERDLFETMKLAFLDYFTAVKCRTSAEIALCALKWYGELLPQKPMEELKQPLPLDVYTTYLKENEGKNVEVPAVSMQRKEYRKLMRQVLL